MIAMKMVFANLHQENVNVMILTMVRIVSWNISNVQMIALLMGSAIIKQEFVNVIKDFIMKIVH